MDYTVHEIPQARILEWVAIPFSRDSSQPRDQTRISCIAGGFFTSLATGIYIYRSNIVTNSIKSLKSDPHFKKIFKKKNFFKKQPFDPFVVHEHDDWVFTLLRDMCLPPSLVTTSAHYLSDVKKKKIKIKIKSSLFKGKAEKCD